MGDESHRISDGARLFVGIWVTMQACDRVGGLGFEMTRVRRNLKYEEVLGLLLCDEKNSHKSSRFYSNIRDMTRTNLQLCSYN